MPDKIIRGAYNVKERDDLASALPNSTHLWYRHKDRCYIIAIKRGPSVINIATISRIQAGKFSRPKKVFNYVARRALFERGIVDMMHRPIND